jgi:glycyl-tRNA synthetase beta chain
MVYEFPELQGIMGEDYAVKAGERGSVAKAINEHYQPRFAGDLAPSEITGAIVSLADKILMRCVDRQQVSFKLFWRTA